jgi:hypothetical protein
MSLKSRSVTAVTKPGINTTSISSKTIGFRNMLVSSFESIGLLSVENLSFINYQRNG